MVCQICGKSSGFYPLCLHHYQMYKKGEVIKCPECKTYCFKSEGCPTCADTTKEGSGEGVAVRTTLLEKWGKRLYAIGMDGTKYAKTEYDEERYESVLDISGEMKEIWGSDPPTVVYIPKKKLETWSNELDKIALKGLEYSEESWDIDRYMGVLDVAESLEGLEESYEVDIDREPLPAESKSRFVADRDIPEAWTEMIQKAQDRVYIASPWIYGVDQFFAILAEAKEKRAVLVKILVRPPEKRKESEHRASVMRLNKSGFFVESYERLHAKMIIVDDKEVYIGSANIVPTSVHDNPEAGICTTDKAVVSDSMLYFEEKWEEAIERKWS